MKTEKNLSQSVLFLSLITAGILLIPLIAMQFTEEVVWTLGDFVFAGILFFGTGLTYKLVTRKSEKPVYKIAFAMACATGFLLVWANGAVGIIGAESNPINLWFYGVLAIGLIGAFLSRFQPKGMTLTLFVTAAGQALVAAIAIGGGYYQAPTSPVVEILGINGFFILLWISSAMMFRHVAEGNGEPDLKAAA